jgi:hypothetical protein
VGGHEVLFVAGNKCFVLGFGAFRRGDIGRNQNAIAEGDGVVWRQREVQLFFAIGENFFA